MKVFPSDLLAEVSLPVFAMQHFITVTTDKATYRWVDGTQAIFYAGNWYVPKGAEFTNLNTNLTGQIDSLDLELDNVDKSFSNMVLNERVTKAPCIIYRVYLDNNMAVYGTPIIVFYGFIDSQNVDRQRGKIQVFNHLVRHRMMTPRRQHTPTCNWLFMDPNSCQYIGEVDTNPNFDLFVKFTRGLWTYNYQNVDDRLNNLIGGGSAVDSDNDGSHLPANAFDGNLTTYWQTNNVAPPHWIRYQFTSTLIINKYRIYPYSSTYAPVDFFFQGSNDGSTWINLDSRFGVSWGSEPFKTFDFTNSKAYLYYRLYINKNTASAYQTILYEIQMFGPADQNNDAEYNSTTLIAGSYYPPLQAAPCVKATSIYSTNYYPYFATDPTKSLTGVGTAARWLSASTFITNQRFHIDLGCTRIIKRIYYENYHQSGGSTNAGAQHFTLWGSNSPAAFADLTYGDDTNWTQLTTSQATFDQHIGADQADPKYITVTNTVAYRYYAFKFSDNYGNTSFLGVTRIELQAEVTDLFGFSNVSLSGTKAFALDTGNSLLTGLLSYFKLDNGIDCISGMNLMNYLGASFAAGKVGNCVSFNGTTQFLQRQSPIVTVINNFSLFGWVYVPNSSDKGCFFFNGLDASAFTNGYGLGVGSGDWNTLGNHLVACLGGAGYVDFGSNIGTGWHFVGMVRNNGTLTGYIDNVACGTTSGSAPVAPTGNFTVGAATPVNGTTGYFFDGKIDELGIWNRPLTAQEMTDLYHAGAGQTLSFTDEFTGISVIVRVRAKQVTAGGRTLAGRIRIAGQDYDATAITPTTSFGNYDFVWTTNPFTGAAWSFADLPTIEGFGYQTPMDAGGHEVDVSECYLRVLNLTTNVTCDLTPTRCVVLNNRDNFGGFAYIYQLQTKEFWWGTVQKVWGGGM